MASTDTIVGIVGAVLLAGLMVTVFVYEYNNAPGDDTEDPDASARAAFAAAHPLLEADEDIDSDATPNYKDADLDGNGVEDANQTGELRWTKAFTGTSPAPPAQTYTQDFPITMATGNQGINGTVSWTVTVPLPQLPTAPNFTCALMSQNETVANCTPGTPAGTGRTLTFGTTEELAPGNYTLRISMSQAGPATAYTATVSVGYGPVRTATIEPDPR